MTVCKLKCDFYKEVIIMTGIGTNEVIEKKITLCNNPVLMVIRTGGVLLQYCVYDEDCEIDCSFYSKYIL